jgi:hypothetical protein
LPHGIAIFFGIRGRNHNHARVFAPSAIPKVPQHFVPIPLREIQVQQHQVRTRCAVFTIGRIEETDGVFSVRNHMQIGFDFRKRNRFADEKQVRMIILDN